MLLPSLSWGPSSDATVYRLDRARAAPGRLLILYGRMLGPLLGGYMLFDKPFAYIHLPGTPLYVGELVLFTGVLGALATTGYLRVAIRDEPVLALLAAYFLWGLFRFLPGLKAYGILAVRDFALVYYCLFAFLTAAALMRSPEILERLIAQLGRFVPWLLTWLPIAVVVGAVGLKAPNVPTTSVPVLFHKPGDAAVAVVVALGALWLFPTGRSPKSRWAWSIVALLALALIATQNRGGLLAAGAGTMVGLAFVKDRLRLVMRAVAVVALGLGLAALLSLKVPSAGPHASSRTVSASQLFANVGSLLGKQEAGNQEGTVAGRDQLWTRILQKQTEDERLIRGSGFGQNLALQVGVLDGGTDNLRSPHNSHLDIMARTGVMGLSLWIALWLGWYWRLVVGCRRLARRGLYGRRQVAVLCLMVTTATLVSSFFDPQLEGAQAAALLWTAFGVGVAVTSFRAWFGSDRDLHLGPEAIRLYELNLDVRERPPGPDHPSTLNSPGNLAAAYRDGDGVTDAIPPPEQTRVTRKSQPSDSVAEHMRPADFRRPPAAPARWALPVGVRRPPAALARQSLPSGLARPPVKLTDHSSTSPTSEPPRRDDQYDREVVTAITAGDPVGIAMAYDRYAAALYGYCHWILHGSTAAAGAVKDTFVIAAATISNLSEPSKLRPWLFALARNECRRRIRPASAIRDREARATDELTDATDGLSDAGDELADVTVQFRAVGGPVGVGDELSDVTVQFRAVGPLADVAGDPSDVTVLARAVEGPVGVGDELSDATVQFRAAGRSAAAGDELSDATVQFQVISQLADPIMPFRVIGQPTYGPGHVNGDQGEAELRSLMHSVMAGLRPREREVIELSFRHDLSDNDLAVVLGVPQSRAHDLAARARSRLEEALGALHIALTGRQACPVLGELLANWDGQLSEQTCDLVVWHIGECQTCAHRGWGAMRPAAFARLLPLAQLPQELREQVLSLSTSTAEDAVAYRRRIVRHAEWIWFARFSRTIRLASWSSIRAHPGVAVAAAAVAVWVVAAVSVTLLTFASSRAAHAQTPDSGATHPQPTQTSVATHSRSPAAATATAPTSAAARPSPTVTQPSAYMPDPGQAVPSRVAATSPAPSRSTSSSPRPSKSPTASRSGSPSPSPSHTASPSPSSSTSPPAA